MKYLSKITKLLKQKICARIKMMAKSSEEDKNKWWAWFKGEWDKKAEI